MNRLIRRGWLFALWLVASWACAQDVLPVPPLAGRVIDQTATLTPAQAQALTTKLAAIETRLGAQLVVLIVPTTQPEDIAAYAQRIADAWKIGRRQVGDGLLIVVAKNDRAVRIEVAKTLEGAVPDLAASRIIAGQITPAFKAGDFAGGLNAAIDQLDKRIAGEGLPAPQAGGADAPGSVGQRGFDLQDLAMYVFPAAAVLSVVLTNLFGRKFGSLLTAGAVGGLGWWLTASLLMAAGAGVLALLLVIVTGASGRAGRSGGLFTGMGAGMGRGWGGGGGGWGGGGFGSGGGGDFGGGGASGRW